MKFRKSVRLINTSRQKKSSPLKLHDTFEGEARALSATGSAIVDHPSGVVVFVSGMWLGERALLKIVQIKKRHAIAEIVELITTAQARRDSVPCEYHGFDTNACGGCPWMFVDEQAQLEAKYQRAAQAIGRVQAKVNIAPIIASSQVLNYRVRAQFKTDGENLGFVANGQNNLVDIKQCAVLNSGCQKILSDLRKQLPNPLWRPGKKQPWKTLDICYQNNDAQVSLDQRLPFAQANEAQNSVMGQWLHHRLAPLNKNHTVVELFAGSGNFTQVIAGCEFKKIVAVEVVEDAVSQLQSLGLPGVQVEKVDLFKQKNCAAFWQNFKTSKILVLDPPRDGFKEKAGLFEYARDLEEVFYISCDLATLARDLQEFVDHKFAIIEAQPVDMFPQTPHLEMLVHLKKIK